MVRVERRVDRLFREGAIQLFLVPHVLCEAGRGSRSLHDLRDPAIRAGKCEVKQRVDPALVIAGVDLLVFPRFSYKIGVRTDLLHCDIQPRQKFNIRCMVIRIEGSHRIETEAVHALIQPEADDLADLLPHCFIRQVKIRHAGPEACFVIKIGTFERLVAGLLFIREIIIRDLRARLGISVSGAKCLHSSPEPGMFRRRVVERQIQDHLDVPGVARLKECFQIGHRPILRVDINVIRHVILVVRRRGEDRHQPDAAAAEIIHCLRIAVIYIVQRLEGTL